MGETIYWRGIEKKAAKELGKLDSSFNRYGYPDFEYRLDWVDKGSMGINYWISCIWGGCILLSFVGWGSFIAAGLFPRKDIDWGQRAVWGVAVSIFIGGILNVCWAVSKVTVFCYVVGGMICFISFNFRRARDFLINIPRKVSDLWQEDKIVCIAVFIVAALLFFHYFALWAGPNPHLHPDDKSAYAVFPQKMLEQGSLGYEPFSERRTSALGGQSFLHTLVLCFLSTDNLHLIDPGIGYLIFIALLLALSKEFQVARRVSFSIAILFLLARPPFRNSTSFMMGMALCLGLFRLFGALQSENSKGIGRLLIAALLISALCASKANFIVFTVIYFISFYVLRLVFESPRIRILLEFSLVAFFSFVFLLPWMISSYQSSGTMLYPLLGRGYHYSAYGIFFEAPPLTYVSIVEGVRNFLYSPSAIFLMVMCLFGLGNSSKAKAIWAWAIFFSAVMACAIIRMVLGDRYSWAFFYASLVSLGVYSFSDQQKIYNSLFRTGYLVLISFIILYFFKDNMFLRISDSFWNHAVWHYSEKDNRKDEKEAVSYRNAQRSVPEGESILIRVSSPSLLDFKRNQILLVDYLILGPKPGMPVLEGAEPVARYLLFNRIRYVMYSYSDEGDFRKKDYLKRVNERFQWLAVQAKLLFAFQDVLMELSKARKKIYDDGKVFVLDLAQK